MFKEPGRATETCPITGSIEMTGADILMMRKKTGVFCAVVVLLFSLAFASWAGETNGALVLQTDFGLKDGAVCTMKGVAFGVNPDLRIFDLTHEIPAFNIWEGAQRLEQTASYWPEGTVFVSVVDPGVGTDRKSIVAKTKTGHFFVTPDNGTLTFIAESLGIEAVRQIDEAINRLGGSEESYTFHGRDVYSYTGARLASGAISFAEVGPELAPEVFRIPYQKAAFEEGVVKGNIPILDSQYGNVWTSISKEVFTSLNPEKGESFLVTILNGQDEVFKDKVPYVHTFGDVPEGDLLLYQNSLGNLSLAINMDDFAGTYGVDSGPEWTILIERPAP